MGFLIQIAVFIFTALRRGLPFIVSLPGLIIAAFAGIAVGFASIAGNIYNSASLLIRLFTLGKESVESLMSWLSGIEYYGFFHSMFAFDILGSVFSSFLTLVLFIIVFTIFDFFFQGLIIAVPFLCFKTLSKILSVVSAGHVKV